MEKVALVTILLFSYCGLKAQADLGSNETSTIEETIGFLNNKINCCSVYWNAYDNHRKDNDEVLTEKYKPRFEMVTFGMKYQVVKIDNGIIEVFYERDNEVTYVIDLKTSPDCVQYFEDRVYLLQQTVRADHSLSTLRILRLLFSSNAMARSFFNALQHLKELSIQKRSDEKANVRSSLPDTFNESANVEETVGFINEKMKCCTIPDDDGADKNFENGVKNQYAVSGKITLGPSGKIRVNREIVYFSSDNELSTNLKNAEKFILHDEYLYLPVNMQFKDNTTDKIVIKLTFANPAIARAVSNAFQHLRDLSKM